MAYSVKTLKPADLEAIAETGGDIHAQIHAKEVLIVTGPGFGTSLKLILIGAAIGAGAALFLKSRQDTAFAPSTCESEQASADLSARMRQLSQRAKSLGTRAKDAVQTAKEIAAPAVQQALDEAKQASRQTESEIKDELRELNDKDKPEQV